MTSASVPSRAAEPGVAGEAASAHQPFVREDHIPAGYSPWRHMRRTLAIAGLLSAAGVALAWRARPLDWALAPGFLVVANLVEYLVHRYPMHRPLWPRIVYRNHAQLHHMAFTDQEMTIDRPVELGLILMPWY